MLSSHVLSKLRGLPAVVTAGSTIGRIDAVRFVEQLSFDSGIASDDFRGKRFDMQNQFRGELGLRIAEALHDCGVSVRLLTRTDLLPGLRPQLPEDCILPFRTFEDLETSLPRLLLEHRPKLVFQVAAVSDWVPKEVLGIDPTARRGKLESDAEELHVVFRKTPKLIDGIRPIVGEDALVVGFKLAVQVTQARLSQLANKQLARARTDFCVANDLVQITETVHPVTLFNKHGEALSFSGSKRETANWLTETILAAHFRDPA